MSTEQKAIGAFSFNDAFSHDWLTNKLKDAAKYANQQGLKFIGLTALTDLKVTLSVDGQTVELPDDIRLDGIEFVRVGSCNPWASKPFKVVGFDTLTGGEIDTLIALVEHGPLDDGDVPSKSARDSLMQKGLVVRVIVKGEDGYQAVTYQGRDVYCNHYNGNTIEEAMSKRKNSKSTIVTLRD